MIEIKPTEDKNTAKTEFENIGKDYNENCFCIYASDKTEVIGKALIGVSGDTVTVFYIEPENDIMLFDGILRSALHVGVEHGARCAVYENTDCEENYEILGFIAEKEKHTLKIENLFGSCSGCSQKK